MKPLSGGGARGEAWRSCASQAGRAAALGAFAIALMPLLAFVPAVWPRLALNALILVPLALATVRLPWRALFTPSLRHLGLGLMAAAALYGAGALVAAALAELPAAAALVSHLAWDLAVLFLWPYLP